MLTPPVGRYGMPKLQNASKPELRRARSHLWRAVLLDVLPKERGAWMQNLKVDRVAHQRVVQVICLLCVLHRGSSRKNQPRG